MDNEAKEAILVQAHQDHEWAAGVEWFRQADEDELQTISAALLILNSAGGVNSLIHNLAVLGLRELHLRARDADN